MFVMYAARSAAGTSVASARFRRAPARSPFASATIAWRWIKVGLADASATARLAGASAAAGWRNQK